jgi:hypothetical protein
LVPRAESCQASAAGNPYLRGAEIGASPSLHSISEIGRPGLGDYEVYVSPVDVAEAAQVEVDAFLHRGGGRPSVSRFALAAGQLSPATASR